MTVKPGSAPEEPEAEAGGGGACTHGVDAERVRASEHAGHARVQLQDPAVSDDAVTATGSRAGGLRDGAEGAGSNARPLQTAERDTYFQSTIFCCSAGEWLELYMADTFHPEPNRLTDLEKQSL